MQSSPPNVEHGEAAVRIRFSKYLVHQVSDDVDSILGERFGLEVELHNVRRAVDVESKLGIYGNVEVAIPRAPCLPLEAPTS